MAKQTTTEKKVATVKDLLNQIVLTAGKSKDEFLADASAAAKTLLAPPPEIEEEDMEDEDYYDSDDYYNSNC